MQSDRNDDEPLETQRERRLRRLEAYEKSSYGQRVRTVQREANERVTGRTQKPD